MRYESNDSSLWNDESLVKMAPGLARMKAWLNLRERELRSLKGQRIESWHCVRMAIREIGPDGSPQFDDPALPFLQCISVYMKSREIGWLKMLAYQNDCDFGIYVKRISELPEDYEDGIYRSESLAQLPTGVIDDVQVFRTEGEEIERIMISIDGRRVWFVGAEAYEEPDGSVRLMCGDESIFVFTEEQSLSSIRWANGNPPGNSVSEGTKQ